MTGLERLNFLERLKELKYNAYTCRHGNLESFDITPTEEYLKALENTEVASKAWDACTYNTVMYYTARDVYWGLREISNTMERELIHKHLEELGERKVHDFRGDDGDHDTNHVIVNFPDLNIIVKSDGTYSSYNGDDNYDEFYVVKAVQVMRTEYEPI